MASPKSVAFHTLGCKLNYSETSAIKRQFEQAGYSTSDFESGADYYVLNTCSVTDFADRKCRYEVRRAQKYNPDAKIIVVGCYAQLKPEEIALIEGVNLVLGANEKFNILHHIESIEHIAETSKVRNSEIREVNSFIEAFSFGDRTRSFLKVQDGCDYKCSFCTIPLARGKSRSDRIDNVVSNAKKIAQLGVKEIVLTGVNIGDFGAPTLSKIPGIENVIEQKAIKTESFLELIKELDIVQEIDRFRISSIEPNLCSYEIIDFVSGSTRFMPHFHMPLQSGSNDILKSMRRRYKKELYRDRVEYIKNKMPHCCIGVDVIVGFPGETEAHFLETYNFINELNISYLHVFTYSERDHTDASKMQGIVPVEVRRERNKRLRILSEKKKNQFYRNHLSQQRPVLFESSNESQLIGFTDNYIKVESEQPMDMLNQINNVTLMELNSKGVVTALAPHLIPD